jgi:competence protein ComEA
MARARPALAAAVAAASVAAVAFVFVAIGPKSSPPPLTLPRAPHVDQAATTNTSSAEVVVDVAGAVVRPGVIRLTSGARVNDAVAATGGPAPDADLDQVNLAARVADGDRVYVPRRGESPPPAAAASGSAAAKPEIVDINAATPDQLDGLPGVGPSTAAAIVEYRTRHRRFRSVDELLDVPGIGPAKLATLRPRVRV